MRCPPQLFLWANTKRDLEGYYSPINVAFRPESCDFVIFVIQGNPRPPQHAFVPRLSSQDDGIDEAGSVAIGQDNSIIVGGSASNNFTMVKLDGDGNFLWQWQVRAHKHTHSAHIYRGIAGVLLLTCMSSL